MEKTNTIQKSYVRFIDPKQKKSTPLNLTVPRVLRDELISYAKKQERAYSAVAQDALIAHLGMEDPR